MFKWLRERRRKKCEAAGHPFRNPVIRKYFAKASEFNRMWPTYSVADCITVAHESCRCGERKQEVELSRSALQGLTMSDASWETLRANGRVLR